MPASLLDPDYQFGTSPLPGASGPPTDLLGLGQLQVTPPPQGQPDLGDALGQTYQMITDAMAKARDHWPSVEEQRGLLQPLPGWQGTAVDAAKQWAEGVMMGTTAPGDVPPPGIVAYHGSPADFNRFSDDFIGTGEGAQAYGRGHYFGGAEETGRSYRDALTPETIPNPEFSAAQQDYNAKYGAVGNAAGATDAEFNAAIAARDAAHEKMKSLPPTIPNPAFPGHMYQVNIGADPEHFLDWDKPLSEQHPVVQDVLRQAAQQHLDTRPSGGPRLRTTEDIAAGRFGNYSGDEAYSAVGGYRGGDVAAAASQRLLDAGIPGIRYLDQGSRGAGQGTHNYVVFDPATIEILRKYGIAGLIAGGGAAATQRQSNAQ